MFPSLPDCYRTADCILRARTLVDQSPVVVVSVSNPEYHHWFSVLMIQPGLLMEENEKDFSDTFYQPMWSCKNSLELNMCSHCLSGLSCLAVLGYSIVMQVWISLRVK